LVLRPALQLRDVPAMTLAIGVAVCETIRAFGVDASLKWPNDVLVGERKLAGILLESQSRGDRLDVVIAGVGINLDAAPDPAVAPRAACVSQERGAPVDRERFVAHLLSNIEQWVDRYVACGLTRVLPVWRALMSRSAHARAVATLGASDRAIEGVIEGLDDDGALLLRDDRGQLHRVTAGDVETAGLGQRPAPPPSGTDDPSVLHPTA
jgi:BirA family biotin operon repressor/biotin-[acetyl-CoA-carboxylase] ligase